MSNFGGYELTGIAAVMSAIAAWLAIIIGGKIQIRLARTTYLRDIKEKRLMHIEDCIAELLSYYTHAVFVLSIPPSKELKRELEQFEEEVNKSNIIYSKLTMQLNSSDKDHQLILKYFEQMSRLMLDVSPSNRPEMIMLIALIRSQAKKIISQEREKLEKL